MILICSKMDPGHPCVMISGSAFLWTRADLDEVDVYSVNGRCELREGIQFRLRLSPVVVGCPIAHECLELCELGAL